MFLALELCLTAIAVAIAYTYPQLGERWFAAVERNLAGLANRRLLAVVTIGLLAIGLRLALLPILPIPVPEIHDEYSHLLLADTLAHGHLANPTHPMWIHFETFHVNWHPTYASMYYPGHALFLAFGQVLLGNPFWGVLLSSGLMCAAICWALQGWMPAAWALAGGLLAVIRLGTFSYWVDSYWGGTVAALSGALVLGAIPRVKQTRRIRDSVILGTGMALLALTRPYEGIFFCVPVVIYLLVWALRQDTPPLKTLLRRIALPAALTLATGLGWMSYYFWRVTGSPFTTPYQINIQTYGLVYFPWQHLKPVAPFHHQVLQSFYRGIDIPNLFNFAHQHPIKLQGCKALVVWLFYFGPLLTAPWIVWCFTRKKGEFWKSIKPDLRFLLWLCACAYISIALTIYVGQPHYAAPMTIALYAATMLVMRDLVVTQSGRSLVRFVFLLAGVLFAIVTVMLTFHADPNPTSARIWCSTPLHNIERAHVSNQLEHTAGKHVVIVRYGAKHDVGDEWVYNSADIDGSEIVWARDMGKQNAELLEYFKNRKAWVVEADDRPVKLIPYTEQSN
jgi:hypothetical protein